MGKKSKDNERKSFKAVLIINLLLVMLLAAALFIFMLLLKSINPEIPRLWSISIYLFIVVLVVLTGVTGIIVFLILAKKKVI